MIIAIDIDGTLRDLESQIEKYFEEDFPDHIEKFLELKGKDYQSLDPVIGRDETIKWLYETRPFELFAMSPRIHRSVIGDLNQFAKACKAQGHQAVIASVQKDKSIIATLHWLSKMGCKIKEYQFFDTMQDKIDYIPFDVYIDDCPQVLEQVHKDPDRIAIKVPYEFNKHIDCPTLDIANGKFNDIYDILKIEREF